MVVEFGVGVAPTQHVANQFHLTVGQHDFTVVLGVVHRAPIIGVVFGSQVSIQTVPTGTDFSCDALAIQAVTNMIVVVVPKKT